MKGIVINIIYFVSIFYLIISCKSDERYQKKIEEIRNIYTKYNYFVDKDSIKSWYINHNESNDIDKKTANFVAYHSLPNNFEHEYVIKKLDSIVLLPNFEKLHILNKFNIYYNLSVQYAYLYQPVKAFEYNLKANSYIDDDILSYKKEKIQLQDLIKKITSDVFIQPYEMLEEKYALLQRAKEENDKENMATQYYNLSIVYILLKDYEKSKKSIDEFFKLKDEVDLANIESSAYGVLCDIYEGLEMPDSIRVIKKKVESLKNRGEMNADDYIYFLVFYSDAMAKYEKAEKLEKVMDTVFYNLKDNCEESYLSNISYKTIAKINYHQKDIKEEKKALLKQLETIENCNIQTAYFINEKLELFNRLLEVDLDLGDVNGIKKWQDSKNELLKVKQERANLFVRINQHILDKDLEYVNENLEFQHNQAEFNRNLNVLYICLFVIILILSAYIFTLIIRNLKFQKKIKTQSKSLQEKNKFITAQNKNMKSIVLALERSNEDLHNFARIAAHDIKSPIASIYNSLTYIGEKYKDVIDENDQRVFKFLEKLSIELTNLINVLLEYSSKEKSLVTDERVEIIPIINKVEKRLAIEGFNGDLQYNKDIPDVKANAVLVNQLFFHLITNAYKFRSEKRPLQIKISYNIKGKRVNFKIEDNGMGIKKENLKIIFKVFEKFHSSGNHSGSGLGLSICKKIVEDFGGNLTVESKWNEGSTFCFSLPLFIKTEEITISTQDKNGAANNL